MSTMENQNGSITEEMLHRYHQLNSEMKRIEDEMNQLKRLFHDYFDNEKGHNQKGEIDIGNFKLQRRIQTKKDFMEEKTVQKLEELNLKDCIKIVKLPDTQKIEAAIRLELLSPSELEDCVFEKITQSIWLKKIN